MALTDHEDLLFIVQVSVRKKGERLFYWNVEEVESCANT